MKAFGSKKGDGQRIRSGQRARPRSRVSLPGNLTTPVRNQSVILADVSATGAKLRGPNLPSNGEFVRLTIGKSIVFGSVVWIKDEECGLAFDHRLLDADVAELRLAAAEAQRLGLSPEMVRAQAGWNNGL